MAAKTLKLDCSYQLAAARPGVASQYVKTVFGIEDTGRRNVIAKGVEVGYAPGRIILFTGPSGSGKSSLLKIAGRKIPRCRTLDEKCSRRKPIIDLLCDDTRDSAKLLAACGLGDATILLRSPYELSDGQRYRFAIAMMLADDAECICADEWCAKLDRITAKVISRNVRKIADRENRSFLLATCHEDIMDDLEPDVIVKCRGGGIVEVIEKRRAGEDGSPGGFRPISFFKRMEITEGSIKDWPYFARWHYRGCGLGPTRKIFLLWDGDQPVGMCVFGFGPLSSSQRNRVFGFGGKLTSQAAAYINRHFASVVRFVLDPRYRGASIAAAFLRRCCELVPYNWIELISEMGNLVPFCQAAGFVKVVDDTDVNFAARNSKRTHYGKSNWTEDGFKKYLRKTRFSRPGYFLYDNRIKKT